MYLRFSLITFLHYNKLHFKRYETDDRRQTVSAHIAFLLEISLAWSLKVAPWLVVTERSGWGSSVASYIGSHYKEFALGINYQHNC